MQLTIVRHAQSTGNAGGRWQGRDDTKLTDLGREQAALLGKRFLSEGYRPSHIYSSPLSRTFATAQIASSAWDLPIVPVDDLMETDIGAFTGLTWEEIESSMPEIAREFAATRSTDIIEGAESYAEKSERARRVVERVIADHSNEDSVLLVSHGGIMQFIIAQIIGSDRLWGLSVRNTGVFDFTIDVDRWCEDGQTLTNQNLWRINLFNDATHLD